MKAFITGIFDFLGKAYWAEITTDNPHCIYYFGPFRNEKEAIAAQSGYVEDLKDEGAEGIIVAIKRCQPEKLTVCDETKDSSCFKPIPALSSQPY